MPLARPSPHPCPSPQRNGGEGNCDHDLKASDRRLRAISILFAVFRCRFRADSRYSLIVVCSAQYLAFGHIAGLIENLDLVDCFEVRVIGELPDHFFVGR